MIRKTIDVLAILAIVTPLSVSAAQSLASPVSVLSASHSAQGPMGHKKAAPSNAAATVGALLKEAATHDAPITPKLRPGPRVMASKPVGQAHPVATHVPAPFFMARLPTTHRTLVVAAPVVPRPVVTVLPKNGHMVPVATPPAPVRVDPFNGQPLSYEALLNKYRLEQVKAKIAQERYNRLRFEAQSAKANGQVNGNVGTTVAIGQLTAEVDTLKNQMETIKTASAAQVTAVRHRKAHAMPRLVAILGTSGDRSALLDVNKHVITVHQGTAIGHWWVAGIHHDTVRLEGPHWIHVLTSQGGIGGMAHPVAVQYRSTPSTTQGGPINGNPLSQLGRRLMAESQNDGQPLPPP